MRPAPSKRPLRVLHSNLTETLLLNLRAHVRHRRRTLMRARRRALADRAVDRPSLESLELALVTLFGGRPGVFIEAGANDGYTQSNTWYLAVEFGWHGLLVEPLPHAAALCRLERPESRVAECALISPELDGTTVELEDVGLMSLVRGALGGDAAEASHIARGASVQKIRPTRRRVLGRTISGLLDAFDLHDVDLFSLDVEGYESEVLAGLDLGRHAPRYLLIETNHSGAAAALLGDRYVDEGQVTSRDRLFRRADLPFKDAPWPARVVPS